MMCQFGPGLPMPPPPMTLVPFISQITASPLSFCHRMSALPSPLKSPVALTCQLEPGLPRLALPSTLVPFSSQITIPPLLFCHSRSDLPSALKSLVGPPADVGRPTKSLGLCTLELAPAAVSLMVPAEVP